MEWLGKHLGYSTMEDWYQIKPEDFTNNGGKGLLSLYENSIHNTLEFVFPMHGWISWKYQHLPSGYPLLFIFILFVLTLFIYWNNITNVHQFLNWLSAELKLQSPKDWLKVDIETIKRYDGQVCQFV